MFLEFVKMLKRYTIIIFLLSSFFIYVRIVHRNGGQCTMGNAAKKRKKPLNKKLLAIPAILVCLLLGAAALAGIRSYRHKKYEEQVRLQMETALAEQREAAFGSLAWADYESVFLSMYDSATITENLFTDFRGIPTLKQEYIFDTAEDLNSALDTVFSSGNNITNVFLGLDPFLLYHSLGDDAYELETALESGLLTLADTHPETRFEILLSFPSLEYWSSLGEGKFRISLVLYRVLTDILNTRDNITVHFPSGQEWLIDNPKNYLNDFLLNPEVAHKLFLLAFCDSQLLITEDNADELMDKFFRLLISRRDSPVQYPDLSQWDIVFFGDSVIGNYGGSISVPGAVNGLSDASVFNCAEGGASATGSESGYYSFPAMVNNFLDEALTPPDNNFGRGLESYRTAKHSVKKLCFIINYGLNDYFNGYPLDDPENACNIGTYLGALRTGIATLREHYPNALYVIAGPGQVTIFENGTMLMGESQKPLSVYSEHAKKLSEELDTLYIDLYHDFPGGDVTLDEVLSDTVHYGEYGRYLFARKIIDLLGEQPPLKQIAH